MFRKLPKMDVCVWMLYQSIFLKWVKEAKVLMKTFPQTIWIFNDRQLILKEAYCLLDCFLRVALDLSI